MRFPQTFIDDLKRQADIVRVVQDYVSLKKKGANWMACCPFHKEKTASFSVSPAKEIFYCFGCHKGGNVFNFVMEMERIAFPEAIKIVAEKTGVPLPKLVDDSRFEARKRDSDQVIELNQWALVWWEDQLKSKSPAAQAARAYLDQRGITEETREAFRLGFAPDSWDALSTHLRQKGATQEQIEKSGLVVKKDEGGSYDRFRGRLMFPVIDAQGRAIAFGGRTLDPEGEPKYLNSPETSAYTKGNHLYGLNLTRDEIRRQGFAILVEGYLDLIVPYQIGVRNIVASLGTALTPEQAKLIARFARKVVVNYDGDRAGVQAAKRAIETILAEDLEVKVLVLPDNADPDDFIRKYGAVEYQKRRGEAQPHIQFVIDQAVRDRNLHSPADKAAAVEETLPFVRAVRSRIQKREYFDITMDALRVQPDQRRELWQRIRSGASTDAAAVSELVRRSPTSRPTVAEERLLELLLANPELRKIVLPRLETADYENLASAPIFRALVSLDEEDKEVGFDSLSAATTDDPQASELLARLMMTETVESFDESLTAADKSLKAIKLLNVERAIEELRAQLAEAQRGADDEKLYRLAMEEQELKKQRGTLLARLEATEAQGN
ncbi:MAG TPA: DNA primase [Pyrinomonadaceae bacterium]|nr:DNA primase [Pyrinomonadaceae bacterium]